MELSQGPKAAAMSSSRRPIPRKPKGFRDLLGDDAVARGYMLSRILNVYRRFGFSLVETPLVEYVDVLGKFLPECGTPEGGIFSFQDSDSQWLALRYDLTAPLARLYAESSKDLPLPFRRCQVGPVFRQEKPGPGRYREFYQCDFDTVGTSSYAADAEICAVLVACFEELGLERGQYRIRVNDRRILNGILDLIELPIGNGPAGSATRLNVLRAIDKLDRLGIDGVRLLLGAGREDESGDFTPGAGLDPSQVDAIMACIETTGKDRESVCVALRDQIEGSPFGATGLDELVEIHGLLEAMELGSDQVVFDPTVVRGLGYYTGPVFEAELIFDSQSTERERQPWGAVAGGGRYDDLVKRFTGRTVPATGASIGIDRLLGALKLLERLRLNLNEVGPVVVTQMERSRMSEYQKVVSELRRAGIGSELYLGEKLGLKSQMKYADSRGAPIVVIAGGRELGMGQITVKNLRQGTEVSTEIVDRKKWTQSRPGQKTVPRSDLVACVKKMLAEIQKGG